ncbi:hypothetical protein BV25DRAFT_1898083 [Artomyces pyxidatus]|uniref:Uncharacterized protein n=1 Tax=Artomyces pyxidatus TaxID=48021 RepID=A0ACB8T9G7_9AGAM|nr:hypothetical protein BV25DRAFT_1898083 [Artomyces pyxidatus]
MDLWTLFRRTRIILFTALIFICLAWAALFVVSIVREWSHYAIFQRAIVLGLLVVHGFTSILLYLMIVVHFRLWMDFVRVVCLLLIHIGSAVLFTLYSPDFPCANLGSEQNCRDMNFVIFVGCWVISGIIVGYAIALAVMACRPRPVESLSGKPEVYLPKSPKAPSIQYSYRRHSSASSVNSRTGLTNPRLSDVMTYEQPRAPPVANGRPEYNLRSENPFSPPWQQSSPPMGYMGGNTPVSMPGAHSAFTDAISRTQSPASFRSMGSTASVPRGMPPATPKSAASPHSAATPHSAVSARSAATPRSASQMPMESLLSPSNPSPFPNPFRDPDPMPRTQSPVSIYSVSSMNSDMGTRDRAGSESSIAGMPPMGSSLPPAYIPGPAPPHAAFQAPNRMLRRSMSNPYTGLNTYALPGPSAGARNGYLTVTSVTGAPRLVPNRGHTTTPGGLSIHSVAASMHSQPSSAYAPQPSAYAPQPSAYTPQPRARQLNAFLRLQPPPPGVLAPASQALYNAPFGTRGPAATILRRYGSQGHSPVSPGQHSVRQMAGVLGERRGSDGQMLDEGQWRRLVMNAANRP